MTKFHRAGVQTDPPPSRNGGSSGSAQGSDLPYVPLDELADEYVRLRRAADQDTGAAQTDFWRRVQQFASSRGELADAYFSPVVPAAVVHITKLHGRRNGEESLDLVFPPSAPPWVIGLLFQIHTLYVEVRQSRVLLPDDSRICFEMIFILVKELLRLAAPATKSISGTGGTTVPLRTRTDVTEEQQYTTEIARARDIYERSAQRRAQTTYFLGMVAGIGILIPACGVIFLAGRFQGIQEMERIANIAAFLIGGVGAIVSVMQRMTSNNLTLRHRAGRLTLLLVGAFRPLVGAIFGLLIYVLLVASLIPIKVPVQTTVGPVVDPFFYFLGALAFVAGFSERFAQDMLATGQGQLSASRMVAGGAAGSGPDPSASPDGGAA